jgi:hypothetical protein
MNHKTWEGWLYVLLRAFLVVAVVCIAVAIAYPPATIRGATGPAGAQGEAGADGADGVGEKGDTGARGKAGKDGDQGKRGDPGAKGAGFWGAK